MAINVKKYTKDQMAKMVEDAQEKTAALEAEIIELKNCIDEKNDLIAELGRANALCVQFQSNLTLASEACYNAEQRTNYVESHPWRNLWAWLKRKLVRHE